LRDMVTYSFIIPARNEEGYIKDCIDSIRNQTVDDWEIIVVDNHSKDNTVEEAKGKSVKIFYEQRKGPSIARNTGANKAKGNILIFTDADVRFNPDFLENLRHIEGGCVFDLRFWDAGFMSNFIFKLWNVTIRFLLRLGKPMTNGSCFVFNKDVFKKVNGFHDDLLTNEDHDIAKKVSKISKFEFFPIKVMTSARRIKENGVPKYLYMHFMNTKHYVLHGASNPDYWK